MHLEDNLQKYIGKEWLGGEKNSAETAIEKTPFSKEEIIVVRIVWLQTYLVSAYSIQMFVQKAVTDLKLFQKTQSPKLNKKVLSTDHLFTTTIFLESACKKASL